MDYGYPYPDPTGSGTCLWLTGLSGVGKSSLAETISRELRLRGVAVEILDGDVVRQYLSQGLGFSKEDRDTNVRRIGFVSNLLSRNGVFVIVAAISPYRAARDEVRSLHEGRMVEVLVDCALDTLVARDVKGLYRRALAGEIERFTGVTDPYEPPLSPHLVVRTDAEPIAETTAKILSWLEREGRIPAGGVAAPLLSAPAPGALDTAGMLA